MSRMTDSPDDMIPPNDWPCIIDPMKEGGNLAMIDVYAPENILMKYVELIALFVYLHLEI